MSSPHTPASTGGQPSSPSADGQSSPLAGARILVIGGARGIGREIASRAAAVGASVVVGARDLDAARSTADGITVASGGRNPAAAVRLDIGDEQTMAAAAAELGAIDHIVTTASARHNVPVSEYRHDAIVTAFDAKVIGPLLLAKHFAPQLSPGGSLLLFSGLAAWKPSRGAAVQGIVNGAVTYVAAHLAVELAPIRVNAIAPGIIDSGVWDSMDTGAKDTFFTARAAGTLAGRVGELTDIADAALWLLGAGFVSGETIHVDGGALHR